MLLFSITSFAMMTDVNGVEPAQIINLNESVIPFTLNNNCSAHPYVKFTLVLANNTLVKGNFLNLNGILPPQVAFDSFNGYLYVANVGSSSVSVINGTTNTIIKIISVGASPDGVSFDSSNGYVYVTSDASDNVSVINGTTNTVFKTFSVGAFSEGVVSDPLNGYLYITTSAFDAVSVFNGTTDTLVKSFAAGSF